MGSIQTPRLMPFVIDDQFLWNRVEGFRGEGNEMMTTQRFFPSLIALPLKWGVALVLLFAAGCAPVKNSSLNQLQEDRADAALSRRSSKTSGDGRTVALTFDHGPTPGVTNEILDLLQRYDIKATFFVITQKAAQHPELLRRMKAEGHLIAAHVDNQPTLGLNELETPPADFIPNLLEARDILQPYRSSEAPLFFRAPKGRWRDHDTTALPDLKGPVFWDVGDKVVLENGRFGAPIAAVDVECWMGKKTDSTKRAQRPFSPSACADGYLSEIENRAGGIVRLHDTDSRTVDLLEQIAPRLIERGHVFLRIDDFLQ